MDGCGLDAGGRRHHPFAVPGDNGMAYFERGAVLECLSGEVTGLCALLTGSMLAQERLMPAGRHFLTGNSPLSLPPPPTGPQAWPQTGFSPCLKSHPGIGMPGSHPRASPPPSSLLGTQDHHWVRGDEAAVL